MNLLITGASSGIGETIARRAVEAGHRVVLMARRTDLLDQLADDLNNQQLNSTVVCPGDVGAWEDGLRAIETGQKTFGSLDGLVNAAGAWVEEPLDTATPGDIEHFIHTDVTGATLITRAILPLLRDNPNGRVIHINGLQGYIRQRPPVLYTMVEAAVRGLCESLRWEAAEYGVHVGLITLGGVANTAPDAPGPEVLHDSERGHLLSRNDVAEAVLFMLSRPSGVNIDELVLTPLGQKF